MGVRGRRCASTLKHAQSIYQAMDKLARTKEKATLRSLGFEYESTSESDSEISDVDENPGPI